MPPRSTTISMVERRQHKVWKIEYRRESLIADRIFSRNIGNLIVDIILNMGYANYIN